MFQTIVVVPCFNEAARLDAAAFLASLEDWPHLQFLFVDDGSTDGTAAMLDRLVEGNPDRLHSLKLTPNRGKAEAVRRGLLRAFELKPELVGFLDADLATPIAEFATMASVFEAPDVLVALASRVALLGRDIRRSPWRHYTGRVFATVASLVLGLQVYDTQCGAKLFRNTEPIRELFQEPFLSSWAFDVEILARLLRLQRAERIPSVAKVVVEVPLHTWVDVRGSKVSLAGSITAAAQLLLVWWRYRA